MATRILLIDDDENDRGAFVRIATQVAPLWTIETADGGKSALEILGLTPRGPRPGLAPDLVILDVNMQPVSGFEVLQKIRSDTATRVIPVIIFSDNDQIAIVNEAYALGANAFVRKPNDINELRNYVASIDQFWFSTVSRPRMPVGIKSASTRKQAC
jgi:CheY-like chemotaxis protein